MSLFLLCTLLTVCRGRKTNVGRPRDLKKESYLFLQPVLAFLSSATPHKRRIIVTCFSPGGTHSASLLHQQALQRPVSLYAICQTREGDSTLAFERTGGRKQDWFALLPERSASRRSKWHCIGVISCRCVNLPISHPLPTKTGLDIMWLGEFWNVSLAPRLNHWHRCLVEEVKRNIQQYMQEKWQQRWKTERTLEHFILPMGSSLPTGTT